METFYLLLLLLINNNNNVRPACINPSQNQSTYRYIINMNFQAVYEDTAALAQRGSTSHICHLYSKKFALDLLVGM